MPNCRLTKTVRRHAVRALSPCISQAPVFTSSLSQFRLLAHHCGCLFQAAFVTLAPLLSLLCSSGFWHWVKAPCGSLLRCASCWLVELAGLQMQIPAESGALDIARFLKTTRLSSNIFPGSALSLCTPFHRFQLLHFPHSLGTSIQPACLQRQCPSQMPL